MGHRKDPIRCKHISTDASEQGPANLVFNLAQVLLTGWRKPEHMQLRQVPMQLYPFGRQGVAHDALHLTANLASASAIRQRLRGGESLAKIVPADLIPVYTKQQQYGWPQYFPWLKYRLQTADLAQLRQVATMAEGLEYRFTQQIDDAIDMTSFLKQVKSKQIGRASCRERVCQYV